MARQTSMPGILFTGLLMCLCAPVAYSQQQIAASSVSSDLLKIYQLTKTATTESTVSGIVSSCKQISNDRRRPRTDRDYAESLLAWALNRRGELRSDRAAKLVEQGKLPEADQLDRIAADDFRAAIEYAPNNWRTHHNYAISLAMKGSYNRAIDELNVAIDLKPDYANSFFNRGELFFELEDYASAIKDYTQAIELKSDDAQYFNSRGHSKFMLQAHSDALLDYERAVELNPKNAAFQTDLADAYQYVGQWKEAAKAYQAAVAADNSYSRAYQNAAWLMATCPDEEFRNPELAVAAAQKALDLDVEETPRGLDTLGAALAASGKTDQASETAANAVQLAADEAQKTEYSQRLALYRQGRVYRQPDTQQTGQDVQPNGRTIRTASSTNR